MQEVIVSVVVPIYNSGKTLMKTLDSLLNQDFQKELYEIILVDDGSTDDSLNIINDLIAKSQVSVKVIKRNGPRGCFSARNEGIKSSNGRFIAFIDSDMVASKDWLTNLIEPLIANESLGAVCGRVISDENQVLISPILVSQEVATNITINEGNTGTGNICYRKDILQLIGGFDERFDPRFRGDSDLGLRCIKAGFKIGYAPNATAYHPVVKISILKTPKHFFKHNKDVLLYAKHGKKSSSLLGGPLTRPILGPFSFMGLSLSTLVIVCFLFPKLLFFLLVVWFPFFITYGYRLVSKCPNNIKIPLSMKIKASIAYPLALLTIYIARVYGSIKYRKFLL